MYNDYLIVSYYTDGCIIVDASRPSNLVEVGNFDTFLRPDLGFNGVWGVYPFLPSKTILATDRDNGLFVLTPNYQRAAFLEGTITDAVNGQNLTEVLVEIPSIGRDAVSGLDGFYKLGYPESGTFEVEVSTFGYATKTVDAVLQQGEITILDIALEPLESIVFEGNVIDAENGNPIANAKWKVSNQYFNAEGETDENGNFEVSGIFDTEYDLFIGKWGFLEISEEAKPFSASADEETFELQTGFQDYFNLDQGWSVTTSSISGVWELGEPIENIIGGFETPVVPAFDDPLDPGNAAYITGNSEEFLIDITLGSHTLSSPFMDMSTWTAPMVSFSHLFQSFTNPALTGLFEPGEGVLEFFIANGNNQAVSLLKLESETFNFREWENVELSLSDVISIDDQMQFIVVATSNNADEITEGLFDNFRAWDADNVTSNSNVFITPLNVFPNPAESSIHITGLDSSTAYQYNVVSISGITIIRNAPLLNANLDVSSLQRGTYLIEVTDDQTGQKRTRKFVKM